MIRTIRFILLLHTTAPAAGGLIAGAVCMTANPHWSIFLASVIVATPTILLSLGLWYGLTKLWPT